MKKYTIFFSLFPNIAEILRIIFFFLKLALSHFLLDFDKQHVNKHYKSHKRFIFIVIGYFMSGFCHGKGY